MMNRARSVLCLAVVAAVAVTGCGGAPSGETVGPESVSCPTNVAAWTSGTAYAAGAIVSYQGTTYRCRQAHTALDNWTPDVVAALWEIVQCSSGGGGGGGSGGGTCNAKTWTAGALYRVGDVVKYPANGQYYVATHDNPGYDPTISTWFWSPTTCTGGGGGTGGGGSSGGTGGGGGGSSGGTGGGGGGTGNGNGMLVFSAYKDTSINMNWNTNVITTKVGGAAAAVGSDLAGAGSHTITLAFATGECGSENWGGVPGAAMATANVSMLNQAGMKYILSTGGAAGSFTCGSDAGFATFVNRWASSGLIGVDFDIEAGQSQQVINDLVSRIKAAHATYPNLRFSLTLATLANNNGASSAQSLGSGVPDSFNAYGDWTMNAVKSILGFNGSPSCWPAYVTVNLMTMDYGSPQAGVCVVSGGLCQMGQSALQAAYNLADHFGVPLSAIELTPMIGGNDVQSEQFTLGDADTVASFAVAHGLAGVHYWSYDRDVDCPAGSASPTCNSLGNAGTRGFLLRFLSHGLK